MEKTSPHLNSPKGRGIYRILFISALSSELKIVKEEIKKLNISKELEISFFESGMGNYKTILNLSIFLLEQKFDFIVNIGVCGWSFDNKTGQTHRYAPTKNNVGVNLCVHPEKFIQISAIQNISNNKELISPVFFEFAKIESIFCSEKIIYCPTSLPLGVTEGGLSFIDMESYGFEMIGDKFNIPRIILKIPIDKIGEETKNFDFEKAKKYLRENIDYNNLLDKILKYLDKNNILKNNFSNSEQNIKDKILNNYKWTFSEKIILEKEINRFIVLELGNLEEFFEENKKLNKKEFLNKLKKISG